ncbi:MAG TPA: glycosyltransferase family 4 protein [Labilithrix sp.]|jgi:glycosyltransferase involved in cell wall biosynthesis
MRVLHLTTEFPWPPTSGGSVRTVKQLELVASLPEVDAITTLSVAEQDVTSERRVEFERSVPKLRVMPPVFHPVHLFDFKRYVPRVVALRALRVPYLAGKWDSRSYRRLVRRELAQAPIDLVYLDHLGMARYLAEIRAERPHARVVLDQHNVESDFFAQFAKRARGPKKIAGVLEHRASVRFEREALRAVDAVVAISGDDAKHFDALAGIRAHVVPVVMPFARRPRPAPDRAHFCYVGNLRWRPNAEGLDWFCANVWPRIRARMPGATFEIAGVGLEKGEVPRAWQVEGALTVGFLEDLEPLYARSTAMLAPILGGSGVRMKLLEGFRAGMPVVTTPDGAFGLPLEDGREALVSPDPDGFADRAVRVANDAALRERLREGGYGYLEKHHSLSAAQGAMRRVLGLA